MPESDDRRTSERLGYPADARAARPAVLDRLAAGEIDVEEAMRQLRPQ